jgi:two-component system response regulator RstA
MPAVLAVVGIGLGLQEQQSATVEDDQRLAELTREYLASNGLRSRLSRMAKATARILAEQPALVTYVAGRRRSSAARQQPAISRGDFDARHRSGRDMTSKLAGDGRRRLRKPVRARVYYWRGHALLRRIRSRQPTQTRPLSVCSLARCKLDHARREASLHAVSD